MISRMQIDFKKYNADGIGSPPRLYPGLIERSEIYPGLTKVQHRWCWFMCTVFPTNKPNHPRAIHPNETVGANIRAQFSQAKCVGAVPACPPERSRSGVSMPKIYALCAGFLTMDAPLWGDAGGHIGTAPTTLHQATRCAITPSGLYFR